ncbi:hypothetical protein [Sphingomonas sp. ABOLG]|uniref:hypothetical protein n=1 Tax=Sphingomonas sp. ABOLG TaxID=1985880 RepID=UPI0013DE1F4C|nr:hypothetical protein [Sphingomonas sp. ABOLG]
MTPNKMRAAAEARALQMALVLAAKVGWRFDRGPLPSNAFAQYLYVHAAQIILVPTSAALPFAIRQVAPVVRETRSDAVIVSLPRGERPAFAIAIWSGRETGWMQPAALWLTDGGEAWLVPAAAGDTPLGFRLGNALHHAAAVPWVSADERQAGLDRAEAWVRRMTRDVIP